MDKSDTKVVIFCGGKGTRLREHTEFIPKPLIKIGSMPILWHIMKSYSSQGYKNFIICLGYKGEHIRQFFINYPNYYNDLQVNLSTGKITPLTNSEEDWNITLVDTGEDAQTARRLWAVKSYLEQDESFLLTYGDGVSNVSIEDLQKFHQSKQSAVTITGVPAKSKYGQIALREDGTIISFTEKPILNDIINGGFMVINKEIFNHPLMKEDVPFEEVLTELSKEGKVAAFIHKGSWHSMDTQKDYEYLNKLWDTNKAEWKTW